MVFLGNAEVGLDAKSRLTVPQKYREALSAGGGLVLTLHPDGCVLLYPKAVFDPMAEELMRAPSMDESVRSWQLMVGGHADHQEFDSAGRVILNQMLRAASGVDTKGIFVGQGKHCEIWEPAKWAERMTGAREVVRRGPPPGTQNIQL
jgi:MraZ protein